MACCRACADAQARGEMEPGTTCTPCADGACPMPGYSPTERLDDGVATTAITIIESPCPTFMTARVDHIVTAAWERNATNVEAITQQVLEAVYARTPDGRAIDWRRLSVDTATCLLELRRRVQARVAYVLAHHDEEAATQRWAAVGGEL